MLSHTHDSAPRSVTTQADIVLGMLRQRGIARLSELMAAGASGTAVARLAHEGIIQRLGRGLYQLPDAASDANQTLAEAAKHAPGAVVCLVSALAFHDLTDTMPSKVWLAIGQKAWKPRFTYPAATFVRFASERLTTNVSTHRLAGVDVRVTDPARTIVDLFHYRKRTGLRIAIEGLKEGLRTRKASPREIANLAIDLKVWRLVQPYLEAMTVDG
jgi:predicted transcriptional regulator of viral defense system